MSLMIIAMAGILLGFLCVMVGFFMEATDGRDNATVPTHPKKMRSMKKRMVGHRKAA